MSGRNGRGNAFSSCGLRRQITEGASRGLVRAFNLVPLSVNLSHPPGGRWPSTDQSAHRSLRLASDLVIARGQVHPKDSMARPRIWRAIEDISCLGQEDKCRPSDSPPGNKVPTFCGVRSGRHDRTAPFTWRTLSVAQADMCAAALPDMRPADWARAHHD